MRIALYSVVDRIGVAPVYRVSFFLKICISLFAMMLGRTAASFLPWLFVMSTIVVAAPLGMFALTISELVDEHRFHSINAGRGAFCH